MSENNSDDNVDEKQSEGFTLQMPPSLGKAGNTPPFNMKSQSRILGYRADRGTQVLQWPNEMRTYMRPWKHD